MRQREISKTRYYSFAVALNEFISSVSCCMLCSIAASINSCSSTWFCKYVSRHMALKESEKVTYLHNTSWLIIKRWKKHIILVIIKVTPEGSWLQVIFVHVCIRHIAYDICRDLGQNGQKTCRKKAVWIFEKQVHNNVTSLTCTDLCAWGSLWRLRL